jgi:hypothetical protein
VYLYRRQGGDFAQTKRLVSLMYGDASRLAESHISNVVGFVFCVLRPRHRDVHKHLFGDPGIDTEYRQYMRRIGEDGHGEGMATILQILLICH